ncbi:Isochorismatase hydrolase [Hypoxylon fragiforme]|uniref:Isochorismatase hydrolase n=1 Tax=Hypoxylon fragiforme TaxID=63214 RepID=UPI0020C6CD12|nr:Isochorismatase hydrolase [Hypoxylon fragiforme]KAI2612545.1 Isochorismatase hydrolase [Hypoxylon fragiforme]
MNYTRISRYTFARGLRSRPIALPSSISFRQSGQRTFIAAYTMESSPRRHFQNPVIFVCDIQEKFRNAIWEFDKILLTAQKVLRAAGTLSIPVVVTTQNAAKLGDTVAELQPLLLPSPRVTLADKTAFSMLRVPAVSRLFPHIKDDGGEPSEVVIVGIESHICVTQTSLDLLARGHRVYVLADGVSSCNEQEIPIALARLRAAGVVVTTSESWLYECMGDAAIPEFREIAKLVKEKSGDTKTTLARLLGGRL